MNKKDPLVQFKNTRSSVANRIEKTLKSMKGMKFVEAIKVTFEKTSGDGVISKTAYFYSQPQIIKYDIQSSLKLTQEEIINKIAVWISEGSVWTVKSVDNHYLNVVK